jgi:hypothetical protein
MYISINGGRVLIWLSKFLSICFLSGAVYLPKQVPDVTGMIKKIVSGLRQRAFRHTPRPLD